MAVQMTLDCIASPSDGATCCIGDCGEDGRWMYRYFGTVVICCREHVLDGAAKTLEHIQEDEVAIGEIMEAHGPLE